MTSSVIQEQLRHLPDGPGVYLMRDAGGTVMYVGKASCLRNRVRSYFVNGASLAYKSEMVAQVADIDFFVTGSEQEALILENNLIKRHRPHYNVRLKDDKTYPYLKIDLADAWPRIYVTRRMEDDGGRYFGPFASASSVRHTLDVIKRLFPLRTCTGPLKGNLERPCLDFHIKRCPAPCTGMVSQKEYAGVVRQIALFLEGKQEKIIKQIEAKMERAAESLQFETAARYRDQIEAIRHVIEGQQIAAKVRGEQDVIAFAQNRDEACVQVFFIRNSKLIGRESFTLQGTKYESPEQIMTSFVKQFYASSPHIPPLILLQYPVEDQAVIEGWLRSKRGGAVELRVPRRGSRKHLVDTVARNAGEGLEQLKIKQLARAGVLDKALAEVQAALDLPRVPERIEAYDISNIQGKMAVGSMVVFEKGKPKPAGYRRFRIKTVAGSNDYAMLQEILSRRFKRGREAAEGWATVPDLVLIDGGKGQLSAAREVMGELGVASVPAAGLAKENEELFVPGKPAPVVLPRNTAGLQLLQRVRDEAHRFAIGYHQKVHRKETFTSALDAVPGVGPKRKRALLRHFGSVRGIREAPEEELAQVKGMTRKLAQKVREYLG